ncbi:hypothetical protein [Streptomyces antimicrobicus]|uniref:Integral membrane protein n=1 Tax=Streptomyces antimicrobicus TaxID=2883108 RepID=A0ABS8BD19_9ACTN|nr:hypothetical protein [Streptomyces antimicrobicus]MCB5182539.1 hypothetical protein [Streptomyces antimicrobicus]
MSGTVSNIEVGALTARSRALAVLRVRSRALAVVLLPTALAVVLVSARMTGRLTGDPWPLVVVGVCVAAALVLLVGGIFAAVVLRARPAVTPTVPLPEDAAPDLYRMVRDLAERLEVPAPSAIALTPDCDSWLEDRTHAAHRRRSISGGSAAPGTARDAAPVLVIGSPFLWWMRVAELRAVLAPVVAGTGPSAQPDIADARRFVRGLDAAVDVGNGRGLGWIARVARLLLRLCGAHAAEMERGVAAAASERAQSVDYGLRIVAQEQVGLAYAGWDRLLTRVALPAWRMGRWPAHLDAGVVSALTELSRRDRLAEGFTSRLGERPACDLLEEPGAVDEAASLLAARLFHGGPAAAGPDWAPVSWSAYPEEVVDRTWRAEAARLHQALDALSAPEGPSHTSQQPRPHPASGTSADQLRPTDPEATAGPGPAPRLGAAAGSGPATHLGSGAATRPDPGMRSGSGAATPLSLSKSPGLSRTGVGRGAASGRVVAGPAADGRTAGGSAPAAVVTGPADAAADPLGGPTLERVLAFLAQGDAAAGDALAGRLSGDLARAERAAGAGAAKARGSDAVPLFPLQPPRSGRDLLADHVTAMVCCAAVDSAGAEPGLDWLDGPVLLVAGERSADLAARVLSLVEDGDAGPLRDWLADLGVRPEKPVRLV